MNFLRTEPTALVEVARFIASANAHPASESLHCPRASSVAIQTYLRREDSFPSGWHRWFFQVTNADGSLAGLIGCQTDPTESKGWLWGPWAAKSNRIQESCGQLLDTMLRALPRTMETLEAFLNVENKHGLQFLRQAGFSLRSPTLLYTAQPPSNAVPNGAKLAASPMLPGKEGLPFLRTAHEIAFLSLHAAIFPAAPQSGQMLLDARSDERVILAAADGLRLLGYICVSVNNTPREGFIDYLAVKPFARGRGVGRWLLQQASRWIFQEKRLPQAALCVMGWREDARRLYETAGFQLFATGVGARLQLRHR